MAAKAKGIVALIFPLIFFFIIFIALVSECNSCGNGSSINPSDYPKISNDEALKRLEGLVNAIKPRDENVTGRKMVQLKEADLADTLPEVSVIDKHYPLTVDIPNPSSNDLILEIFCSTEKSGKKAPDDWFTRVVTEFNRKRMTTSKGKVIQIKLRYIDSGTGHFYIRAGKYLPDAFSPSNHLWLAMIEAAGIKITPISERLVGNTAGVVMKKETYEKLKTTYGSVDIKAIIDAVAQGNIAMGYTNPYASSTGLNFLVTVLATYASGDQAKFLAPEVISSFEAFQKGVPYVAFTTIQMRESVQKDGALDAFVLEYQTFLQEPNLVQEYQFVPFGVRHDNPLYGIGELDNEKIEALKALARYAEANSRLADDYKFNADNSYRSAFAIPDGKLLIQALNLWKEKKDAGRPVAAVFVADVSGSMEGYPLKNLKVALKEGASFISSQNSIGLVKYSTHVTRLLPIGTFNALQQSRYLAAVANMEAEEDTAMFDGILVGLKMLVDFRKSNPNHKAILFVLTDGNTNAGVCQSFRDLASIIDALDIPVYTIAYGEDLNTGLLKALALINEAAYLDAKDEAIINKISSLLNAEM